MMHNYDIMPIKRCKQCGVSLPNPASISLVLADNDYCAICKPISIIEPMRECKLCGVSLTDPTSVSIVAGDNDYCAICKPLSAYNPPEYGSPSRIMYDVVFRDGDYQKKDDIRRFNSLDLTGRTLLSYTALNPSEESSPNYVLTVKCHLCGQQHSGTGVCPALFTSHGITVNTPELIRGSIVSEFDPATSMTVHSATDPGFSKSTCGWCGQQHRGEVCLTYPRLTTIMPNTVESLSDPRIVSWSDPMRAAILEGGLNTATSGLILDTKLGREALNGLSRLPDSEPSEEFLVRVQVMERRMDKLEALIEAVGLRTGDSDLEVAQKARMVVRKLEERRYTTARAEINEAVRDITRTPRPDPSGAVQHAVAGLECAARAITGRRDKLGTLLRKYYGKLGLDRTYASMLEKKVWNPGSDRGRHLREGNAPGEIEAKQILWQVLEALERMLVYSRKAE